MNLLELNFKIDSNLVEALDLYMRRIGACGVSFEDPRDAINIIEAQEKGEEDASIFFDPSFIEDLTEEAEVKVWFKRDLKKESYNKSFSSEDKVDKVENIDKVDRISSKYEGEKKALPSTSVVYIYSEARDIIDNEEQFINEENYTEVDLNESEKNIFSIKDNPYYVDRDIELEDLNSEINLDKFFPKAGGNEYCEEGHSVEEFFSIFSRHLKTFLSFFFVEDEISWSSKEIEEKDWLEAYKEHYGIVRISDKIVVCPSWKKYNHQVGEIVINLDPESAFGTGMHASTAMCARFIEKYASEYSQVCNGKEMKILDLGTGSGILAIIAEKLLGNRVDSFIIEACDIDSNAIRVAKENSVKNQCTRIKAFVGSLNSIKGSFDLIIANLISDLQLRFASEYTKFLNTEGVLIVSGIIEERADEVIEKFTQSGLKIIEKSSQNGWIALICNKLS